MKPMEDKAELDKHKAEELIASVPLIAEVEGIEVELHTDSTGDPAFRLTFRLRRDVEMEPPFMHRFLAFSKEIEEKILRSDLHRFPYTQVERAA